MKLKVMTIVGTRRELIKLSRVIAELDRHVQQILVHTGQNFDYELNDVFFEQLDIRRPDFSLKTAGDSPAKTIAAVISGVDDVLHKERPAPALLSGDTKSCLPVHPAKAPQIPVFTMDACNP